MNQTNDNYPDTFGALNADQAARFLSISRATLYRMVRAGEVPVKRLNGRTVFLREELQDFLRALPDGGAMSVARPANQNQTAAKGRAA